MTEKHLWVRSSRALLAVTVVVAGGLLFTEPANAAPSAPAAPTVVTLADASGQVGSARALTGSEITAKGLGRYVDMSKLAQTTPQFDSTHGRVKPDQRPAGSVSPAASGCWNGTFGWGLNSFPVLYGATDVTWCGDGTWVTYASSNCYGSSGWPTYQYGGCSNSPNYGAGWNLYQVKTQWSLCNYYVPVWGSCLGWLYPWEQFQFLGSGVVYWNGGWS